MSDTPQNGAAPRQDPAERRDAIADVLDKARRAYEGTHRQIGPTFRSGGLRDRVAGFRVMCGRRPADESRACLKWARRLVALCARLLSLPTLPGPPPSAPAQVMRTVMGDWTVAPRGRWRTITRCAIFLTEAALRHAAAVAAAGQLVDPSERFRRLRDGLGAASRQIAPQVRELHRCNPSLATAASERVGLLLADLGAGWLAYAEREAEGGCRPTAGPRATPPAQVAHKAERLVGRSHAGPERTDLCRLPDDRLVMRRFAAGGGLGEAGAVRFISAEDAREWLAARPCAPLLAACVRVLQSLDSPEGLAGHKLTAAAELEVRGLWRMMREMVVNGLSQTYPPEPELPDLRAARAAAGVALRWCQDLQERSFSAGATAEGPAANPPIGPAPSSPGAQDGRGQTGQPPTSEPESAPPPQPTPAEQPEAQSASGGAGSPPPPADAILFHGDPGRSRAYSIGTHQAVAVSEREHAVLQAFLSVAPALDGGSLSRACNLGSEDAVGVLAALRTKYEGIFEPAITIPGGKGKGGYRVRIAPAPKT
jgi:hypothetical protein